MHKVLIALKEKVQEAENGDSEAAKTRQKLGKVMYTPSRIRHFLALLESQGEEIDVFEIDSRLGELSDSLKLICFNPFLVC